MGNLTWVAPAAGFVLLFAIIGFVGRERAISKTSVLVAMLAAVLCAFPYLKTFGFKGAGIERDFSTYQLLQQDIARCPGTL